MEYMCTKVRFTFFNGLKNYTVEYVPSLRTWYVFDEYSENNCVAAYNLGKKEKAVCNYSAADDILNRYFEDERSVASKD